MKRISLAAFALTFTAASMTMAQPPGGGRGEEGGRGQGGGDASSMVERMMTFDKNEDGKISKEEAPERLQSMFARADKNEDGFLTKDEITAEVGGRQGQREPGRGEGPEGGRGGRRGSAEGMRPEAGRGGFGGAQSGGRSGFGGPSAVLAILDADGDGQLSADEIDLAVVSLKKLDKNKDGKLDSSELASPGPEGRGPVMGGGPGGGFGGGNMSEFMLQRFDADKDGKLSGDEIPERMRENLEAVDTNKDKSIDKAELDAMANRFPGGGPGGPAGGRAGFGGGRPGGEGEGRGPGGEGGERKRPPIEE